MFPFYYFFFGHSNIDVTSKPRQTVFYESIESSVFRYQSKSSSLPWTIPYVAASTSSQEFMHQLASIKHQHGIQLPWEKNATTGFKLSTPIFVLNLPKSGTTTMQAYFKCGGLWSAHTFTRAERGGVERISNCLLRNYLEDVQNARNQSNVTQNVEPLKGCHDNKAVYADIGDYGKNPSRCYYSTLHEGGLEYLAKFYPNSTFILLTREPKSWYNSVRKWQGSIMFSRWRNWCGFPGYLIDGTEEERWAHFYKAHTQKVREFVIKNLGITYIESELEKAADVMEYYTGITNNCFKDCKPGQGCSSNSSVSEHPARL
jgi:hypothetical protein